MRNLTACPSCGQPTDLTGANLYRPFCSRRCRLVDLGGWLNEERRIADDGPDERIIDDETESMLIDDRHSRH